MSLISIATYDQLEIMTKSAVATGLHDHATGRHHVPLTLLEKLQGLSQKYSLALKAYRDDKAMGKDLRKRRNEVSARLARHVRNIHFMFHRLFGMGDVKRLDMALFGIPETSMREAAHRIDVWRHQAGLIVRGFHERQTQGHDPLPPYLMSEAIIELIAQQKRLADGVAAELHRLQTDSQKRHQHLQGLRGQLVHQMEWLHKHLEVSLFEHQRPIRIQIMRNYGIPVSLRGRSAQPQDKAETDFQTTPELAEAQEDVGTEEISPPAVAKGKPVKVQPKPEIQQPAVADKEFSKSKQPAPDQAKPHIAKEPDSLAESKQTARIAREPKARRSKLRREEFVEIPDEKWDRHISEDPDGSAGPGGSTTSIDRDVELDYHLSPPKQTAPKKPAKERPVVTKGQRKPLSKKEKEKKKTNRKISRKSRRGK